MTAAITAATTASADADAALASDILNLDTSLGSISASLSADYYTKTQTDQAVSSAVTTIEANLDDVAASVTSEALARTNADAALAADVSNLEATVTQNNNTLSAAIENAETVSADSDAALASNITTLDARLSNFSAQSVFSESWMANDAINSWERQSNGLGEVSIIEVADSPVGSKVLNVGNNSGNDEYWASSVNLIPFDSTRLYKMTVVARQISGNGRVYFGYTGMAADGVTLCNQSGLNTTSSQHYHAASSETLGSEWATFVGYSKGFGTPNGNVGAATADYPKTMHENVRFIRPMFIVGYNDEPGQVQIASIVVEDVTEVQNASAAIQAEAAVRADEDAALAASITSLSSEIGGVSAGLTANYYTRTATDAAIAAESTSLQAQIGTVQANLNTESAARVSEDAAFSSQITSLTADLGSLSASVTENYLTATQTNQAIAASATTLDASIDGLSATVTQQGSSIATLQGNASAGYLIKAQAGGAVSLLDLVAADGAGGSVSVARIAADDILLDGSVRANKLSTDELITLSAQIKNAIITDAKIASLSAAKLVAGTALTSSLTVNGTALSTIETQANDPAARINAASTEIDPGKIKISGSTTLADWRTGGDSTQINGGAIAANTVAANKLTIGARNLSLEEIVFEYNSPADDQISWSAGTISYENDLGVAVSQTIAAGNATWTAGTLYIYWDKDTAVLGSTSVIATAYAENRVILATYKGSNRLQANFGRTVIDGSSIKTGSIGADQISVSSLSALAASLGDIEVSSANIADGAITNAKIGAAAIQAANIGVAQIGTANIINGAVTNRFAAFTAGAQSIGSSYVLVQSISIDADGNPISVTFTGTINGTVNGSLDIRLNGVSQRVYNLSGGVAPDRNFQEIWYPQTNTVNLIVTPALGTHTIAVYAKRGTYFSGPNVSNRFIQTMELKR